MGEEFVGGAGAVFGRELRQLGALENRARIQAEAPRLLVEQPPAQLDAPNTLLSLQDVPDLAAGARRDDETEPVAARLVAGLRDDLDDVAVLQARAERNHPPVDAGADALIADVGVNGVGEIDGGCSARQRSHLALRREDVDLLRIQVDLEVLQELLRIPHLLLHFEQLPHPLEVPLVVVIADASLLVLPVRGDPFLGAAVHLLGADLHFQWKAMLADHRRMQRLIAVRPRHGDEVLDAAGNRRPGLVDDAERGIAILDGLRDDPQRDEVVDALEIDLLPFELEMDAVEAFDAAIQLDHGYLGVLQTSADGARQLVDDGLRGLPLCFDLRAQALVRFGLQVFERQLLELVLDLAHAEAVGDRGVDIEDRKSVV